MFLATLLHTQKFAWLHGWSGTKTLTPRTCRSNKNTIHRTPCRDISEKLHYSLFGYKNNVIENVYRLLYLFVTCLFCNIFVANDFDVNLLLGAIIFLFLRSLYLEFLSVIHSLLFIKNRMSVLVTHEKIVMTCFDRYMYEMGCITLYDILHDNY